MLRGRSVARERVKGFKKACPWGRFRCEGGFWVPKASSFSYFRKYHFSANGERQPACWRAEVFYFLATAATARMMRAMPRSSQKPKVRRKMRKEKRMEDSGSMAEIMLASVGRI